MISSQNNELLNVLRTLVYYDIFEYPLSKEEIVEHSCSRRKDENSCSKALSYLVENNIIYKIDRFYSLSNNPEHIENRLKGNDLAKQWMLKAKRFSKFISNFPYVRGISLSGSLSKGYIGEDPDIDYFIITKENRLWLSRTLLVAFKKIFLFNSYKYFCVNYFIDTNNLEIEEKNLFTATELSTLIPVYGKAVKQRFFECNRWVKDYYPNYLTQQQKELTSQPTGLFKKITERIFNNKMGDFLDNYCMKITIKHWAKKFKHKYTDEEFMLLFKSGKSISKHHPRNFQNIVLKKFNEKMASIKKSHKKALDNFYNSVSI